MPNQTHISGQIAFYVFYHGQERREEVKEQIRELQRALKRQIRRKKNR